MSSKDRRGLAWTEYLRMVVAEPSRQSRAILRLMGDCGLRAREIVAIDLADVFGEPGDTDCLLLLHNVPRTSVELVHLESVTIGAVRRWIAKRRRSPGPLFKTECGPLSVSAVRRIVAVAGARVGLEVAPVDLRRCSIDRMLQVTRGDVRVTMKFARHTSIRETMRHDAARRAGRGRRRVATPPLGVEPLFESALATCRELDSTPE